jgi:hypothetical protein
MPGDSRLSRTARINRDRRKQVRRVWRNWEAEVVGRACFRRGCVTRSIARWRSGATGSRSPAPLSTARSLLFSAPRRPIDCPANGISGDVGPCSPPTGSSHGPSYPAAADFCHCAREPVFVTSVGDRIDRTSVLKRGSPSGSAEKERVPTKKCPRRNLAAGQRRGCGLPTFNQLCSVVRTRISVTATRRSGVTM